MYGKCNCICFREDQNEETLWVVWNDCAMADYIARRIPKCILEYTIEINPPEYVETPVKSVMYHTIPDLQIARPTGNDRDDVDGTKKPLNSKWLSIENKFKYQIRFDASEIQGKEVNITLATELDGKTVTQVNFLQTIKIKQKQQIANNETPHSTELESLVYSNIPFIDENPVQDIIVPKDISFNTESIRKISNLDHTGKTSSAPNNVKAVRNRKESYGVQNRNAESDTKNNNIGKDRYNILNENVPIISNK